MSARALLVALALGAPLAAQAADAPLPEPACRAVLQALDRAFASGEVDRYAALFQPEQPWLHAVHKQAVALRLASGTRLQRASELLAAPRAIGARTVLLVGTTTTAADGRELRERAYVVLRPALGGEPLPRPVLWCDLPPRGELCTDGETFTCAACNYTLGGVAGWLCAPVPPERAGAIEGSVFVRLGSDIAVEITVQLGDDAQPAGRVVDRLAQQLVQQVPGARADMTQPWLPAGLGDALPATVSAARATVTLPDGELAIWHATALGRLRHVLLLRGSARQLEQQRTAVDALLASYHLLTTDGALAEQHAASLRVHTGGALLEGSYTNAPCAVAIDGPTGWRAIERGTGAAFQVAWTAPFGDQRLLASGHRPPSGLTAWTEVLADRWLAAFAQRAGFALAADDGWRSNAQGERERTLRGTQDDGAAVRIVRVVLRQDVLLVADGRRPASADASVLDRAIASLRRP